MIEPSGAQLRRAIAFRAGQVPDGISAGAGFAGAVIEAAMDTCGLALDRVCEERAGWHGGGHAPDQFRERALIDDGDRLVLAGIRFRNLDRDFPFVELTANFDLVEAGAYRPLAVAAVERFSALSPKGVLLTGRGVAPPPGASVWVHTLLGHTASAAAGDPPVGLTYRVAQAVDFHESYRTSYAEWQAQSPDIAPFVKAEPLADLEAAAAANLCIRGDDDHGWCAVAAGRVEPFYGAPALYIFEILLAARWRGRGAAQSLDGALVRQSPATCLYVFEHIADANRPSLAVARRQGRTIIESEYFLAVQALRPA